MDVTTPLADQLTRYMDLAAAQLKATATNMANVDTPGFHTVGFDFEAERRRFRDERVETTNDRLITVQFFLRMRERHLDQTLAFGFAVKT